MTVESLAANLVGRAINWIVIGAALALFAEILLRVMRRQNSGTRFAVWFSALVGVALLPFSTYGTLSLQPGGTVVPSGLVLPASWAVYLFAVWGTLALVGLARIALGLMRIRKLRSNSTEIPLSDLPRRLRSRLEPKFCRRRITLYQSKQVRVPVAIGFFRPAVILPCWALNEMSMTELDAALLHEIAHIRRWDDITNLVQKVLAAFLFFHPAVWWIEKRLALNREMACDDVVLRETANRRQYAECLVSLAEKSLLRRGIALAQAAVSHMRDTRIRVSQILNTNGPAVTTVWKPALALMTAVSLLTIPASNWIPQGVYFQQSTLASSADANGSAVKNPVIPGIARHDQPQTPAPANLSAPIRQTSAGKTKSVSPAPTGMVSAKLGRRWPAPMPIHVAEAQPVKARPQAGVGPDAYLVVMQTHSTSEGAVYWSIGVVQFTIFLPQQSRAQEVLPAKSI